jgi:hypothetical protein
MNKAMQKKVLKGVSGLNHRNLIKAIGGLDKWSHRCHEASLALVRTGLLPEGARVARGWRVGVGSQHSWIVFGNAYETPCIVDPTYWSYSGEAPYIFTSNFDMAEYYRPHGAGIFLIGDMEEPYVREREEIKLDGLSPKAMKFLKTFAPDGLDAMGWNKVGKLPMTGWPSKEIVTAMAKDKRVRALLQIDIIGMVTDLNPSNLYW